MSITDTDQIDAIGTDAEIGSVGLLISDHLDWENPEIHLNLLQDKLNSYLTYIETGQMMEQYPDAMNRAIVIRLYAKEAIPEEYHWFYTKAEELLRKAGFGFEWKIIKE